MEDMRSAGQKFIDAKLANHPNIKGGIDIVLSILNFILGGHVIVWLVNKLVMTAGFIAESVLMLGTLWITSELVAGKGVNAWIATLPGGSTTLPAQITTLCVMAFSLLPEIILLAAIVKTFKHWWITCHQSSWPARIGQGVWAVLYTVPTATFLVLVWITFQKLTSVTDLANLANLTQAGTDTIQTRVVAGWSYSIIEMIYPLIMKTILELQKNQYDLPVTIDLSGSTVAQVVAQTVVHEPLDIEALRASIVDEIKPLIQAPVVQPQIEPPTIEDILQKLTPIVAQNVAQTVAPEPLDYDRLAQSLAPHFAGQIRTMRATIIEEVKTAMPQIAAPFTAPLAVEASKKPAKRTTAEEPEKEPEASIEERLELALQDMLSQGKKPSVRSLATATGVYRAKVTGWLKANHPEYIEVKNGGSNDGSMSQSEEANDDEAGGSNSGSNDEHEPISEELPVIDVQGEPVFEPVS